MQCLGGSTPTVFLLCSCNICERKLLPILTLLALLAPQAGRAGGRRVNSSNYSDMQRAAISQSSPAQSNHTHAQGVMNPGQRVEKSVPFRVAT